MDITSILIIALVSVAIGYVAGLMISNLHHDAESKLEPKTPSEYVSRSDPTYLNVANFVRDTINGPLYVDLDGTLHRTVGELTPDLRTRLEELTIELHGWLGYPLTPSRAPAGIFNLDEPDVPAAEPVVKPVVIQTVPVADHIPTGKTGPLVRQAGQSAPVQAKKAASSIVEQIDEILQANLSGTEYMDRGIRLIETPNRGVAVNVGLDHYQLDEVPDPAIRQMIRAAVSEWELQAN